ncbi:MAG: hypothetical protein PVJ33_17395 [Lysobacterales bacterium]|jgi:hypothetical protein
MKKILVMALFSVPLIALAKGSEDNPTTVIVDNTPSVEVVNTPSVTIDGTPSVQISGAPDVNVSNEVDTNPRIRQMSSLDIDGFGLIFDIHKICDDPEDSPPCVLWRIDANAPASLTHLSVAVGESTATGDSKCSASIIAKNDTLSLYRALINLQSQAGQLRTFERTYPIPVDLDDPDTVIEVSLTRRSGTGTCMLEASGFGTNTLLE